LLDGKHKIAMDFNAFEQLEVIYGDMQTAFEKFSPKKDKGTENAEDANPPSTKFADVKNFLCAGINACIEDPDEHFTPYEIGKRLNIRKMTEYVSTLMPLLNGSMPDKKETDEDSGRGKKLDSQDRPDWDWAWLMYLATNILQMTEKSFWKSTPRQLDALYTIHKEVKRNW